MSPTPSSDALQDAGSTSDIKSPTTAAAPVLATSDFTPNLFFPILVKVEFDIDRRMAGWFDAWMHMRWERSQQKSNGNGRRVLGLSERVGESETLRGSVGMEVCGVE